MSPSPEPAGVVHGVRCAVPTGLVRPVPRDPAGRSGPTRAQARGRGWRRTSHGLYVPAEVDRTVEQRILEASAAVPGGVVTGWAALRLRRAGYLDGLGADGVVELAVEVLVPDQARPTAVPGVRLLRDMHLSTTAVDVLHGVRCVSPERATYDGMRLADDLRAAVVVLDMAAAAAITSLRRVGRFVDAAPRRSGIAQARAALALASESSRSPRETWLRLVWVLDAGLPPPEVNRGVRRRDGAFVGVADLLDVSAGMTGEYDGAAHRTRARHRKDAARGARFRDAGIETFAVVAGDDEATAVERMLGARSRALWLPESERSWELIPRDPAEQSLDERLDEQDLIEELLRHEASVANPPGIS